MLLPMTCNEVKLVGTVDTGSQATLVNTDIAIANEWPTIPSTQRFWGARGQLLEVIGMTTVKLEVQIGKIAKEKWHRVAVTRGLAAEMLIGLDPMAALEMVVDTGPKEKSFASDLCKKTGMF